MKTLKALASIVLSLAVFPASSQAEPVLLFGDVTFTPSASPQTITVPVTLYDPTNVEDLLSYDLPVEIGGDGRGISSPYFTLIGFQQVASFPGGGSFGVNTATFLTQNYEAIVSDAGTVINSSIDLSTPVVLFNVLIQAAPNVPVGTSIGLFVTDTGSIPPQFTLLTTAGAYFALPSGSTGAGSITAVPEAAHLITAAMGVAICGSTAVSYARRRRRGIAS